MRIAGPPTRELVEVVQETLEREQWHRERKAAQENPPGYWAMKVEEINNALDALEELGRRAQYYDKGEF